ncbi:hypothetical protein BRARA_D01141 [Brassica rapa]|uniref:Uncharacterized protein n=1 Tax=Brassica campestris TaxID=3711 RepID=A0A397ZKI9_BRACM|nr:hypothetical protein BRARA_D01141 [Brassica rapa]
MGNGERGRSSKKMKYGGKDDHKMKNTQNEEYYLGDDADEDSRDGEGEKMNTDFSKLELKPDHGNRPLWACADGRIFLETFSPLYKQAYDFLIAIAEPVCRPESMHEYNLTPHSLYAAVSVGLETETIISVLNKLSKTKLPKDMIDFINASTANYGKVKLVLKKNRYFIESPFPEVLKKLGNDVVISKARFYEPYGGDGFTVGKTSGELEAGHGELLNAAELAAAAEEKETHSFEIDPALVETVKQRCLPSELNYPMLEEYDFRNDNVNPDLDMELKPHAQPRPYQEKSLSKMFGNGRARSGIIVLPCGAGKSLYNAFFYSLVSTDTQEMYYSTKRQQFLIDQGYSFKVITSLPPADAGSSLSYHSQEEQLSLLAKVLNAGDDLVGLEQLEEDTDGMALQAARRRKGLMSEMSGAKGFVYQEFNSGRHKSSGQQSRKPKDPTKRHQLFKKRFV